MDVLCTDKTGTLTEDKIILERNINLEGDEDLKVLKYAYLNSFYLLPLVSTPPIVSRGLTQNLDAATYTSGSTWTCRVRTRWPRGRSSNATTRSSG